MSSATIHTASRTARDHEARAADPKRVEKARTIFLSLSKFLSAKTIYADNSPLVSRFRESFHQALRAFFQGEHELVLTVEQYQLKWHGETVYDNREKKESLAFLLFKDGVGELTIQASAKADELEQFADLIKSEICCPTPQSDMVSKLWQAEFTNISYRVFDEAADGKPGEGGGAGGDSGEQQLRANDHANLLDQERGGRGNSAHISRSAESLGKHLRALVERDHPGAGAHEKEQHLQDLIEALFATRAEELASWRQDFAGFRDRDKLLWLLNNMLEFTRMNNPAPVIRDVLDIATRLVHCIAEEGNIRTIRALLEIQRTIAGDSRTAAGFESLPQRIKHELTNTSFLLALGKRLGRARNDTHEILDYFKSIGNNAVPALREILSTSNDPSIHAEVCEALHAVARDYIMSVIEDFRLDNPLEALDAVYLLQRCATTEIPPIVQKILASSDQRVRAAAAAYLAKIGTDEATALLRTLLDDRDRNVRIAALAAVEESSHPSITARVISMCFEEDLATKSMEELDRQFRTVAKLAGTSILPQLRRMATSRSLLPIGGGRAKQNKLLAVTALKHIPGPESHAMLEKLAGDGDGLVRSKAVHALNAHDALGEAGASEEVPAAAGGESDG